MRLPSTKRTATVVVTLAALAALPVPAGAVLSGPSSNGRIIFTSGRSNGDAQARLYLRTVMGSTGSGTATAFTPLGGQSRNASWSPDRTKAVYANGDAATGKYDLYVWDFVERTVTPLNGVPAIVDDRSSDHPAWSPDGTRVAYVDQPAAGSAERNIMVKRVGTSAPPVALTTGAPVEGKPAWSPDSQTIYYHRVGFFNDLDIVREPATGGAVTNVQAASGLDEYQPSISPDGSKMCFTGQPPGNPSKSDVYVTSFANPGFLTDVSNNPGGGDINCTWSPDGTKIAYVRGIFAQGELMMTNADDSSPLPISLEQDPGADNFDGNPDWAPDGRPDCGDSTVTTPADTAVTIPLVCTDTGPEYEQTPVRETVANGGGPQNGTVDDFVPLADPSTVTYTPNQGFAGTDSIKSIGFDSFGFGTDQGTISIVVLPAGGGDGGGPGAGGGGVGAGVPRCGGRLATIFGTARSDTLAGTNGPDVIAGLRGNDTIRGGGGRDVICGGAGRDRIAGERGNDRLLGGAGADRLSGNQGNDRLAGNAGNDSLAGGRGRDRLNGAAGRDRLNGGPGPDRLNGGPGRDRLNGGAARDRCNGGKARDRAARCERSVGRAGT